jgi:hypothetical protein
MTDDNDFGSAIQAIPTGTNMPPIQNKNIRLLPLGGEILSFIMPLLPQNLFPRMYPVLGMS